MMIFRVMHAVPYSNQAPVQDVIANLHSYFTCNLLIGLAVLLSYKQFGGRPIECMLPLTGISFNKAWEQYAETYCWSEDTYYVSFNETVELFNPQQKRDKRISYYQWMPFFLLFQAACFKVPTLIWKYFGSQSGMRVGEVLRLATNEANSDPNTRKANIQALAMHLKGALKFHYRLKKKNLLPHKFIRCLNIKYSSYYVAVIYIFSKTAFLINVLGQTELLNRYLIPSAQKNFGLWAWFGIWSGNTTWEESGLFPRVSLCDFEVREMGQTTTHTVQCVLLLNVFTEKAFMILWAWYNVLSLITLANLTTWFFGLLNPRSQAHFIINHLEMSGDKAFLADTPEGLKEVQIQVDKFIDKYLRTDGIFILKLIAQHADVVFTTDLIAELWMHHYMIEDKRQNIFKEIQLTEDKWKEKLRRLEAIEARSRQSEEEPYIPKLANLHQNPSPYMVRRESVQSITSELKRHRSVEDVSVPIGDYESSSDEEYMTANSRRGSRQSAKRRGSRTSPEKPPVKFS